MGLGQNYADQHAKALEFLREHFRHTNIDEIAWTSDPDEHQNCFAFAVGSHVWWQPPSFAGDDEGDPRHSWSNTAPNNTWIASYAAVAKEEFDFVECDNEAWEDGFRKIVLMHRGGVFKHAAVQITPGKWRSKLGGLSDLEHSLENMVAGGGFGKGVLFMKKQLPPVV